MVKYMSLLMFLFPLTLNAQSFSGYVKDSENGTPLTGVNVVVEGSGFGLGFGFDFGLRGYLDCHR